MLYSMLVNIPTPCHVIDIDTLFLNIERLNVLKRKTDITLLFAIKGFSNDRIIKQFIHHFDGICASGLWEAHLAKQLHAKQIHTYSPAYTQHNFKKIVNYSDFIVFNSLSQWSQFGAEALAANRICGIRINPEYSEIQKDSINPCHYASRFGIRADDLACFDFKNITGIHFHTMCEQYSDVLCQTLNIVEKKFSEYLYKVDWLNIGGGQYYCDPTYNLQEAIEAINYFQNKYSLKVIIEPCETVMSNAGYFVATVTDIVINELHTAILDASAICHLPDIIHSPYRCNVINAYGPNEKKYKYRLAGCTCYAGDIFGDYSFDAPLCVGSRIIFQDTAAYSMVKSNIFNGIELPYYATIRDKKIFSIEKRYDYNTFLSLI